MAAGNFFPVSSAYTLYNKVQLVRGGNEYFAILHRMIEEAQQSIHLQTYILEADETGTAVTDALIRAVNRGVHVYLLIDGYASQQLPAAFIAALKKSGIQFRWFEPVFKSRRFYVGRRLHQKVVVTDALHSLTGGVNISNRYNDLPAQPAWLDWAVYCKGQVSAELYNLCMDTWNKAGWGKKKNQLLKEKITVQFKEAECLVRVRRNDWVRGKNQISRSYLEMFRKAESHIIIMSSYFLPGRSFRKNMAQAAKRGVQMKIITAGTSDVALVKHAERYLYRWMLKNKIAIYEYQPIVLHGKLSTCDSRFVTVGSYNINNLSAYASIELNLDVHNKSFAANVEQQLNTIMLSDCIQVTEKWFEQHNTFLKRIWQRTCFEIIRFLVFLFTFYMRQRG